MRFPSSITYRYLPDVTSKLHDLLAGINLGSGVNIPWPADIVIATAVVVGFIKKLIVPGYILDREREEKLAAQKAKDLLTDKVIDQAIPALEKSAAAEGRLVDVLPELLEIVRVFKAEAVADRERRVRAETQLETIRSINQERGSPWQGQSSSRTSLPPPQEGDSA